jgi:hypothetical protein
MADTVTDTVVGAISDAAVSDAAWPVFPAVAGLALPEPYVPGSGDRVPAELRLILLAATVLLIKLGSDRWGPGRTRGVATGAEAEQLLGVARLRRSRKIVRPDLYGKRRQGVRR